MDKEIEFIYLTRRLFYLIQAHHKSLTTLFNKLSDADTKEDAYLIKYYIREIKNNSKFRRIVSMCCDISQEPLSENYRDII